MCSQSSESKSRTPSKGAGTIKRINFHKSHHTGSYFERETAMDSDLTAKGKPHKMTTITELIQKIASNLPPLVTP